MPDDNIIPTDPFMACAILFVSAVALPALTYWALGFWRRLGKADEATRVRF